RNLPTGLRGFPGRVPNLTTKLGLTAAPQCHSGTAFGLLSDQFARERLRDFSAAFIFVHELSREIIGKGSYLERGSTAARVNGVQLDPIKLIIGKDRDELPGLEFGPAHPSRGERYSEPRFRAGDDAVGRGDLNWPFHGYGRCPP